MVTAPEVAHTVKLDNMPPSKLRVKTDVILTTLTPVMVPSGIKILTLSMYFFYSHNETLWVEILKLCFFFGTHLALPDGICQSPCCECDPDTQKSSARTLQ